MVEEDKNKEHNKKEIKEDTMVKEKTVIFIKEKFMIFIIGFLIGAIVATSGCIIYNKVTGNNSVIEQSNRIDGGPPGMPGSQNGGQGELPEMPGNQNGEQGTPPEKPSDQYGDHRKPSKRSDNNSNKGSDIQNSN